MSPIKKEVFWLITVLMIAGIVTGCYLYTCDSVALIHCILWWVIVLLQTTLLGLTIHQGRLKKRIRVLFDDKEQDEE
jgi:small-conductance mechanosensitive channel